MKNSGKFIFSIVVSIVLTLGFSLSMRAVIAAWTAPTVAPPNGFTESLLHTGSANQSKKGYLMLGDAGNPNRQLHVKTAAGNAEIDIQSGGGNYWAIYQHGSSGDLRFWNVATGNLLVLDTANAYVGIGTDNPSEKFDVVGNIELNGSLNCTSCIDANDLAANSVGSSELAANSVGSSEVINNSLTASDLADVVEGADSRCANTSFLRGDGVCRTAAQIVSDGGGGSSMLSGWPDAIKCGSASSFSIFYLKLLDGGNVAYGAPGSSNGKWLKYSYTTGDYVDSADSTPGMSSCKNVNISTIPSFYLKN